MPLELGVWRIVNGLKEVEYGPLSLESRLEQILEDNISIASPNWLIIGRQVQTDYGGFLDLLAIDRDANLIVLELKRDQAYRDIIAQVFDYGSWIVQLNNERITRIFEDYQKKYNKQPRLSIDDAFKNKFRIPIPDEMNTDHELVIVASSLDPATERVVLHLSEMYGIRINVVFFRVFQDEDREYLSRAWFRDPTEISSEKRIEISGGEWNGEYYVSFGYEIEYVRDGLKRGYVVAGGGSWYSGTLGMLEPGARIWVHMPGCGYIGVGIVKEEMKIIDDFLVIDEAGNELPITKASQIAAFLKQAKKDPSTANYLVRVEWLKTIDPDDAIWEKGFFANQNSVARPRTAKWDHTVERLKNRFNIL